MDQQKNIVKQVKICGADIAAFSIAFGPNATETEQFAASQLQSHIQTATGVLLPLAEQGKHRIVIGPAHKDTSAIQYDGFVVETDDASLYLYGAIPRGTLYAVYEFLEKYIGFRKYEQGIERLLSGNVDIPRFLRDVQNPVFEYRVTDWLTHVQGGSFAAWERINSSRTGPMEGMGGTIPILGGCHTFERLCDPNQYFDEHPEYYSLIDGKRIPASNAPNRPSAQLCLTNPDVLRIVTENVKKQLENHHDKVIVDVSQNDNYNYCQCESCAAIDAEEGGPTGTMLRFVNAVAEAIKEYRPNALVQTFAYQYTRKPPKITKPADNVIIRLCSIEACFRHALNDPTCEKNRDFAADMDGWRKICDKISVWDYTTNYNGYFAPYPNIGILLQNVRYFADSNVIHLFEEDTPGTHTGDLAPLRAYLLSRAMWNPYMSDEEYDGHIRDFLEGYFGAGWKNVYRYIQILLETTAEKHIGCFDHVDTMLAEGFDDKAALRLQPYQEILESHYLTDFLVRLDEVQALWDAVEAKASTPEERERIIRARMSLDYLDLFCQPHIKEKMTEAEKKAHEEAFAGFLERKERFKQHVNLYTATTGY
jgi:hypothetical protein